LIERQGTIEQLVAPHLDAAFNLARWLTRNITTRKTWSKRRCCALSAS